LEFRFDSHVIAVNVPDAATLLALAEARLTAREGFALATINLDHLVKLRDDPGFSKVYSAQDLVVADGNPIVWLSRLAGRPVSLVPGSDMVMPLMRLAARLDVGVGFFGSDQATLDAAAQRLGAEVPGLRIVARIAPPMGFDPDGPAARAALEGLRDAGAGLVFVALGAPKQERFALFGRSVTPQIGFASIGAGLDFLTGRQVRAPRWVRAIAMEWLWRMLSNPRRLFGRYARSAMILPGEAWRAWRLRG